MFKTVSTCALLHTGLTSVSSPELQINQQRNMRRSLSPSLGLVSFAVLGLPRQLGGDGSSEVMLATSRLFVVARLWVRHLLFGALRASRGSVGLDNYP